MSSNFRFYLVMPLLPRRDHQQSQIESRYIISLTLRILIFSFSSPQHQKSRLRPSSFLIFKQLNFYINFTQLLIVRSLYFYYRDHPTSTINFTRLLISRSLDFLYQDTSTFRYSDHSYIWYQDNPTFGYPDYSSIWFPPHLTSDIKTS